MLKTLLFDAESSANIAYTWGKYEQNVLGDFIKERQIMCFSWKWLNEKETHVLALPDFKGYKKNPDNNRALILRLHELFSRADVIVGHNLDQFDSKMSNTDFVKNGLPPPPPHKTVDTLKVARKYFRFNSNKLGDLGKLLKVGDKINTGGFELWVKCMAGDLKAWAHMKRYNKGDVILLEKVYLKLRPWMTNHPDMNMADKHVGCPQCRSVNLIARGWSLSNAGKSPRFQCKDCGKWSRGALVKKELRYR